MGQWSSNLLQRPTEQHFIVKRGLISKDAAHSGQGTPLGELAKQLNRMVKVPMTQAEAVKILDIEESENKQIDPKIVMKVIKLNEFQEI